MHYYRYASAEISCWYKYLLFSYNIIFWLAGVAFLGAGLWAWSEKGVLFDLSKMTRLHGFDPVFLILFVGGVMFVLGFAGCVGALRENICLLKFFCGTIVLIFILELALAVLAFLFQDWVKDRVETFFKNNIKAYRDDIDLQNLIDSLQKLQNVVNTQCGYDVRNMVSISSFFISSFLTSFYQPSVLWKIGALGKKKKEGRRRKKKKKEKKKKKKKKKANDWLMKHVNPHSLSHWEERIFTKGCIAALETWLPRNIYIVAGVFVAISLLQIFGIYLAKMLISDIDAVKSGFYFPR
ncbi:hypothetical protein Chor_015087 [Crotalus horridus]